MVNENSIYAFLTAFMFASLGIFAKYVFQYNNINANIMFFSSLLFSTVFLFIILIIKYKNFSFLKISKENLKSAIICSSLFALFLSNLLGLQSLEYIDAGIQKVIVYSDPLFILIINILFLKKKINKSDIFNITLILIGLFLIIGKIDFLNNKNILLGIILSAFASFFVALYSVLEENTKVKIENPITYWFYSFALATFYLSLYITFTKEIVNIKYIFFDLKLFLLLLSSAILNFALPYITFLKSLNTIGAIKTGIILSLCPVITIILSVFILNEQLNFMQICGTLLIIGASIISSLK